MTAPQLEIGDRARFVVEGEVQDITGTAILLDVGAGIPATIPLDYQSDAIRLDLHFPPNWPPQPGDVWISEADPDPDDPEAHHGPDPICWLARLDRDFEHRRANLLLVPADGDLEYSTTAPDDVLKAHHGRMRLAFRMQAKGTDR